MLFSGTKLRLKFDANCLKQEKVTFTHKTIVNVYIVAINLWSFNLGTNFILGNPLFGVAN